MLVSTKGRYALRIMIDLAEHQRDGYIPLKETAGRQGISEKYLEGIIQIKCLPESAEKAADTNLPNHRISIQ